jgi:integrase
LRASPCLALDGRRGLPEGLLDREELASLAAPGGDVLLSVSAMAWGQRAKPFELSQDRLNRPALDLADSPPMARWIRMAAATGLRRGDLQRLQWSHLTDTSIELATAKSRGRKRIIVPLLPEAKAVIAECREAERLGAQIVTEAGRTPVAPLHVMTTAQGKPWSKDGPTGMWVKACKLAQPRIEKHLHDLRGNFATLLMGHGISDEQIAIQGLQCENVVAIRRRYVDRDRIARGIADRLAGL